MLQCRGRNAILSVNGVLDTSFNHHDAMGVWHQYCTSVLHMGLPPKMCLFYLYVPASRLLTSNLCFRASGDLLSSSGRAMTSSRTRRGDSSSTSGSESNLVLRLPGDCSKMSGRWRAMSSRGRPRDLNRAARSGKAFASVSADLHGFTGTAFSFDWYLMIFHAVQFCRYSIHI